MATKHTSAVSAVSTVYSLRATFVSKDGSRKTSKLVADNLDLATGLEKKDGLMQVEACVAAYLEPKRGKSQSK